MVQLILPTAPPSRSSLRPGLLGKSMLLVVVAIAPPGCKTVSTPKPGEAASAAKPQPSAEQASQKTEFHRDISPEQQFNVHVDMARIYESQGNNEAAVAEYQKAVEVCERKGSLISGSKIGPAQQALAQRRMAGAFDRMGRFAQSDVHYQRALKLAPKDPKVWNDAGYSYYLRNRYADAERALKTSDKYEPNNPRVLTNLGLALSAQGKDEEALAALSRAGGPAIGHANLGYILAAQGKTAEARRHYEQALAAQPSLAAARAALASLDSNAKSAPSAVASLGANRPGSVDAGVSRTSSTLPPLPASQPAPSRPAPPATRDSGLVKTSASSPPLPSRFTPFDRGSGKSSPQ